METVSRRNRPCALCNTRNSSPAGEHVVPQWFWKYCLATGPYVFEVNGGAVMNEDGTAEISQNNRPYFQLNCCEECNDVLNRRFEQPCIKAVQEAFSGADLTDGDAELASFWLLKTLLLMAHPSRKDGWNINEIAWNDHSIDPELYEWMTSGALPPSDLSLFIHRFSSSNQGTATMTMKLPRLMWSESQKHSQGALIGLKNWGFTLVHHPGWKFEHPLESDPTVEQIWPPQGATNLSKIPTRNDWPLEFQEESILLSGQPSPGLNLPPLTVDTRFHEISGYSGLGPIPNADEPELLDSLGMRLSPSPIRPTSNEGAR